jgi:hypothetical protein
MSGAWWLPDYFSVSSSESWTGFIPQSVNAIDMQPLIPEPLL